MTSDESDRRLTPSRARDYCQPGRGADAYRGRYPRASQALPERPTAPGPSPAIAGPEHDRIAIVIAPACGRRGVRPSPRRSHRAVPDEGGRLPQASRDVSGARTDRRIAPANWSRVQPRSRHGAARGHVSEILLQNTPLTDALARLTERFRDARAAEQARRSPPFCIYLYSWARAAKSHGASLVKAVKQPATDDPDLRY